MSAQVQFDRINYTMGLQRCVIRCQAGSCSNPKIASFWLCFGIQEIQAIASTLCDRTQLVFCVLVAPQVQCGICDCSVSAPFT